MTATVAQFTMTQLAERLHGALRGDGGVVVTGVNALDDAEGDQISFIINAKFARRWPASKAAAAIVSDTIDPGTFVDDGRPLIFVSDAEMASLEVLGLFAPPESLPDPGVHPTAWVHETARVEASARIGPHVSVDRRSRIGDGVVLHAGVRIGADVTVGSQSVIHGNTVIRDRCVIGRRVILHPNVTIGADGFGYRPAPDGSRLLKMPHIGDVVIEDDVEVGASTCIDRGKFGSTRIGKGTKIDNLVQIAHNCQIGQNCVIAGMVAIAGSVELGDFVKVAGGVGIVEHTKLGDGASIGAHTLVMQDVGAGAYHLGLPGDLSGKTLRQWAAIRKLPDLIKRLPREPDTSD